MPLVEENRKLHDEVKLLKHLLDEQSVRVDRMLEAGPRTYSRVSVTVNAFKRMVMFREDLNRELMTELAASLLTANLLAKVEEADGMVTFTAYFIGVKK
jgi:hypothetical protein